MKPASLTGDLTLLSLSPSFRQRRPGRVADDHPQRYGVQADSVTSDLAASGVELAHWRGVNANFGVRHLFAQPRHSRALAAAMARVTAIAALVVYAAGVRLLLLHLALWLATCEQFARWALGFPIRW